MSDERDFIERAQSLAEKRSGRNLSPAEMATEFSMWGNEDRSKYLDSIEAESSSLGPLSLNQATRRHAYHRALKQTHERLRKIDR